MSLGESQEEALPRCRHIGLHHRIDLLRVRKTFAKLVRLVIYVLIAQKCAITKSAMQRNPVTV